MNAIELRAKRTVLTLTAILVVTFFLPKALASNGQAVPACGEVLLAEDFESCPAGTWIGNCNEWQTWANGGSPSSFFITDQEHVSGTQALQVSGSGSCWEGATYKPLTGNRVLLQAMMKASGDGPNGCHHRQNGVEINVAGWSFEMPQGEYQGGLMCYAVGGGSFTAVPGFENAVGQWYAVAVEVDYCTGLARFWLDGQLVWSTSFDTEVPVTRVWLRSGEGRGWFDDVLVCEADKLPACPGDIDGDGTVGVLDLLELLANWDSCP